MNTRRRRAVDLAESVVDKLLAHAGQTSSDLARALDVPLDVMDAILRLLAWDGQAIALDTEPGSEVRYRGRDTPTPDADHQPDSFWGDGEFPVALSFTAISAAGYVVNYSASVGWRCTCPEFHADEGCEHIGPDHVVWDLDAHEPGELSVSTAAL